MHAGRHQNSRRGANPIKLNLFLCTYWRLRVVGSPILYRRPATGKRSPRDVMRASVEALRCRLGYFYRSGFLPLPLLPRTSIICRFRGFILRVSRFERRNCSYPGSVFSSLACCKIPPACQTGFGRFQNNTILLCSRATSRVGTNGERQ